MSSGVVILDIFLGHESLHHRVTAVLGLTVGCGELMILDTYDRVKDKSITSKTMQAGLGKDLGFPGKIRFRNSCEGLSSSSCNWKSLSPERE